MAKKATKTINKSAKTGKFVSEKQLKKNPDTTYKQKIVLKKGSAK